MDVERPEVTVLRKWIEAEVSVISEFSGDMNADWRKLIEDAKQLGEAMNVDWDEEFVPEYVRDSLRWQEEWDDG